MLPLVVIAGRPNVGKSTLFNRLAGKRAALIADTPGVTRDRRETTATLRGRRVRLMDTAGLEEAAAETLPGRMRASSEAAVAEADLVVFVVDARVGITAADTHFGQWLRKQNLKVLVVANKAEGRSAATEAVDAYRLGLGEPVAVSAEHGEGIADLMSEIAGLLPPEEKGDEHDVQPRALRLAIVGRPNAGKSTLVNRLFGAERMITGPEPGLTRDAVTLEMSDARGGIELVDTAGLRRRSRVEQSLEKMSTSAAIEALKMAEVVALALDASEGVVHDQDLQIARLVEREGRACVLVLTKWDAVVDQQKTRRTIADRLAISLAQMKGLQIVALSALTGAGVEHLLPAVRAAHDVWNRRVSTGELNRWFEEALERHQPPLVQGRRLKLRYVTQAKARPPTFVLFGTRAEQLPEDYQRYLVNSLRENFNLPGTPIRLQMRGTRNPYASETSG